MATKKKKKEKNGLIAENRRARYEFSLEDTYEAGIQLTGTEVKSLREGQANIAESYVSPENGEIMLINANIPEYQQAGPFYQHAPRRPRRLLLHKKEIARIAQAVDRQELRRILIDAVRALADRERTVVAMYYFEAMTLAEIGRILDVTESRISQIHAKAVLSLRNRLSLALRSG